MSIKRGRIKIIDDIDPGKFFTFKQSGADYYAVGHEDLGYIVFSLPSDLSAKFKSNGYSSRIMVKLFEEKIEDFYFISFADEDYKTEIVEFVGTISKEQVLEIYNEGKLDKNYGYGISS